MAVYPISAHIVGDADRLTLLKRERDKAQLAEMAAWVEAEAERARVAHVAARAGPERGRGKANAAAAVDDLAAIAESAFDRLRSILRWADGLSDGTAGVARALVVEIRARKAVRARKSAAAKTAAEASAASRKAARIAIQKVWLRECQSGGKRGAYSRAARKLGLSHTYIRKIILETQRAFETRQR